MRRPMQAPNPVVPARRKSAALEQILTRMVGASP